MAKQIESRKTVTLNLLHSSIFFPLNLLFVAKGCISVIKSRAYAHNEAQIAKDNKYFRARKIVMGNIT